CRAVGWAALTSPRKGRGQGVVRAVGGAEMPPDEGRGAIVEASLVVCLEATAETIASRLGAARAERPLLAGSGDVDRLRRLKAQRAPLYALADFTVHTDGRAPDDIAAAIVRFVEENSEAAWDRPGRLPQLTATPPGLPGILDAPGAAAIVRTASADYPAYVGWGELDRLGEYTRKATNARRAFVLSDRNVLALWGEQAISSLR